MNKIMAVLAAVVLLSSASAAGTGTIKVKTFPMTTWGTSEGSITLPYTYQASKAEEFDRLTHSADFKPYYDYLVSITRELGHGGNCGNRHLSFLPGTSEAAFRRNQAIWLKALQTPTATNKPLQRYRASKHEVSQDGIYSAESVVYRMTEKSMGDTFEWLHIYTFVYNKRLQNGVLLTCESNKII